MSELTARPETAATPEATEVPTLDSTGTGEEIIAAGSDTHFAYTPQRAGFYRFSVTGAGGTLTVLRAADGTVAASDTWYSGQSSDAGVTVHLDANETVYLTQTAQQTFLYSFAVEQQVLTVFDSEGNITVHLDAQRAGRYIFAVYDNDGKALKFLDRTVAEGETIQSIGQVRGAAFVKAFCIGENYAPQGNAKEAQVTQL